MKFVIITGVSGSGKSQALKFLEDMGYFCVDNLPPMLLGNLADACIHSADKFDKAAVVMDIRGGEFFNGIFEALNDLNAKNCKYEILYLDASDNVLIKRYKETRHTHPLEGRGTLSDGIRKEKEILFPIRERANYVINTSDISLNRLRGKLIQYFSTSLSEEKMHVTIFSFGFKRGIPLEADMVFDVRFLPNPYYVDELRALTGLNKEIEEYLMKFDDAKETFEKLVDLLEFVLPLYSYQIKSQFTLAIGCTGGMHRSVLFAELLKKRLEKSYTVDVVHRDLEIEEKRIGAK